MVLCIMKNRTTWSCFLGITFCLTGFGCMPETESGVEMDHAVVKTDAEWRAQLTPEQFRVTRRAGTERAFAGEYWNHKEKGLYACVCCGAQLFRSDAKFDSGCGWPSYFEPVTDGSITEKRDMSHGMIRTEVVCSKCDAHLGHVFPDGPPPTGLRYCINSASIVFKAADELTE